MAVVALAALSGIGGARRAEAMFQTHAMVLDSVATMVAADLLRGTAIDRPVVLLVPIAGDSLDLLSQRLLERLQAGGRDVRIRERPLPVRGMPPPTLPPGMSTEAPAGDSRVAELHARVDGVGVTYVRRIRSFPFGVKGYERVVSMRASATLLDPGSGQVLWSRRASRAASDIVEKRDLVYAAGGSEALDPPLPRGSGLKILEPLIVIGVVAGLVVLFYSNRN
jgi:hypothetical protein